MHATGKVLGSSIALISLLLGGCGFHLRGYDLQGAVESFAIVGKTRIQVAQPLRQALSQAGVAEVSPDQADVTVELLDQRKDRRSVSTTGSGRAAEYETSYAVQYALSRSGEMLIPPTWIERERVYRVDRGNIVGSNEEQTILEREMLRDVAGQIVRAMSAVSRAASQAQADAG